MGVSLDHPGLLDDPVERLIQRNRELLAYAERVREAARQTAAEATEIALVLRHRREELEQGVRGLQRRFLYDRC